MRLNLKFDLENEFFPIQYRKNILSFIKLSLSEYSEEYYKKLYNSKDTIIKPYTFAIFLKNPKFEGDKIDLEDKKFELNVSIAGYDIAIMLYNAFNHQKNKKFSLNNNSWILKNINPLPDKNIDSERLIIKFMSPLVVRSRINQKDYYYSYGDENFKNVLRINIKNQLTIAELPEEMVNEFDIKAIQNKKVIIKFYEKKIETSTGIFEISGDKQLLKYLYDAGMGSKRSSGFGMFQIL